MPEADDALLPVFVKLAGRSVVVVGGGAVATAKVRALRPTGARITVVAPAVSDAIGLTGVTIVRRRVRPADLAQAWLVVSAATPAVNRFVASVAEGLGVFVNAVDDPANASAYLGSVVRREGVTIAVSTSGRAPAMASLIGQALGASLPDDLEWWLEVSDRLRRQWRRDGVPVRARRPALLEALVGSYPRTPSGARGPGCFPPGLVSLVGAGLGDPELLTVRAMRRLEAADVVFHDGLVPDIVLAVARSAELVSVARRDGERRPTHGDVMRSVIAAARRRLRVVRLKSGDPFVLGRGGEDLAALAEAGVPVEVVPGLTSAVAAPALAGIPVTQRGVSSALVVVSGHSERAYRRVLGGLVPGSVTLVVLMGVARRDRLVTSLLSAGWAASTPTAVLADASRPTACVWTGPLSRLGGDLGLGQVDTPGVIVIGGVVAMHDVSRLESGAIPVADSPEDRRVAHRAREE